MFIMNLICFSKANCVLDDVLEYMHLHAHTLASFHVHIQGKDTCDIKR